MPAPDTDRQRSLGEGEDGVGRTLTIERMDGNEDIFVRLMNDEAFRNVAASHLMRAVYQQVKAAES